MNANYLQADQNIATQRGHLIPSPAHIAGSASFLRWQAPPRSVTSRRTTVIAAMGDGSAVADQAGRYLLRSTVRTLPMGQVRGFPGCERVDGRTCPNAPAAVGDLRVRDANA